MAKIDFKDDILNSSMNGKRQYTLVDNPNGTVSLNDVTVYDQMGDDFGAKEVNDIGKEINFANIIQTAGGTATAITLSDIPDLVSGLIITFVVATNNNGAATTINGKSLYKPGTTQAPNLIAGKAVTIWYNGTHFFIKASAEGDAIAGNVLAGKTFSNDDDTGITGTMVNRGAVSQTLNAGASYTVPAGYHNGSGTVTGNSLASQTSGTATAAQILSGQTTWVNGTKITGTMVNRGAPIEELNAGDFYNIPPGYYSGGVIAAKSLASQTSATATVARIHSGYTAWVNGTRLTGTAPIRYYAQNTAYWDETGTLQIRPGFTPLVCVAKATLGGHVYAVSLDSINPQYCFWSKGSTEGGRRAAGGVSNGVNFANYGDGISNTGNYTAVSMA